jgi:hypothetical protein
VKYYKDKVVADYKVVANLKNQHNNRTGIPKIWKRKLGMLQATLANQQVVMANQQDEAAK